MKMVEFSTFKGSWPWPRIGSYCMPSCITRRPLPTYQISLLSNKHLRTDRWGHLRPTLLGRLGEGDLKRNMRNYNKTSCPYGGIARPFVCPHGVTSRFWLARRHTSPLFPHAAGLRSSSINLEIFWVHKMSLVMRMTCRSAVAHSTPHQQVALTVSSDMQLALDLMVIPMIRLQK